MPADGEALLLLEGIAPRPAPLVHYGEFGCCIILVYSGYSINKLVSSQRFSKILNISVVVFTVGNCKSWFSY